MAKEKSCGAVIFISSPDVKYLLLQYTEEHWDYPKGHMEQGETEEATALRELKEETGIYHVSLIPGFKENIRYFYTKNKEKISKEVVFFLMESHTTNVLLSNEHIGFEWLPYEEALERLTFKNAKDVLKKAHRFLLSL